MIGSRGGALKQHLPLATIFHPLRGDTKPMARIYYARVDEFWRKEEKYAYLDEKQHRGNIEWQEIEPDAKHNWLTKGMHDEFEGFISIGGKDSKSSAKRDVQTVFKNYGPLPT